MRIRVYCWLCLYPSHINILRRSCYSNFDTISFEDVKSNLLSKEKFDHDIHANFVAGLVVRGRPTEKVGMVVGERTVLSLEILMLVRPAISVVNWVILLLTAGN